MCILRKAIYETLHNLLIHWLRFFKNGMTTFRMWKPACTVNTESLKIDCSIAMNSTSEKAQRLLASLLMHNPITQQHAHNTTGGVASTGWPLALNFNFFSHKTTH